MGERFEHFGDEGSNYYREEYREHIREELQVKVDELRRIHADLERIVESMRHDVMLPEEGQ